MKVKTICSKKFHETGPALVFLLSNWLSVLKVPFFKLKPFSLLTCVLLSLLYVITGTSKGS